MIDSKKTWTLIGAVAIGVWSGSAGFAHADPQCPGMTAAQCSSYESCLSVYATIDVPVGGDSLEDPGGCRRSALLYTAPS